MPEVTPINGGGSSRLYYRLKAGDISVVGVICHEIEENRSFIKLSRFLEREGLNVPRVISVSSSEDAYLQTDLGDMMLSSLLTGTEKMALSKKALDELIHFQTLDEEAWNKQVSHKPFSKRLTGWDLNYFKYDFLKPYGIDFNEDRLEDDFENLSEALTSPDIIKGLMYRDFQSRNVMWKDGKPWLIDFQGARKGPVAYDAASFIWQAKAPFSLEERKELEEYYASRFETKTGIEKNKILKQLELMALFRTLQVLGAYGFRGLIQKKSHFIESIPFAIRNLDYLAGNGVLDSFPELKAIAGKLYNSNPSPEKREEEGNLLVTVFSFSYKKGYPEDSSGNGGGFMFDCRAIHNPGRYEEYKSKTGRDEEVIKFLEATPEAAKFVENAFELVKPSVDHYLKRGFTSLQVGFGCTGGQHRSVFCADRFAKKLKQSYPGLQVKVIHREQNFTE